MTSNAIAAMRMQEERRHNLATEEEAGKSRRSDFASSLLGSAIRGLGTGVLSKLLSNTPISNTIAQAIQRNKNSKRGGNK